MKGVIVILFLVLILGVVNAESVLDQINVGPYNSNSLTPVGAYMKAAQEFFPSRTADVVLVQVPISYDSGDAGDIILEIQTDSEGHPSGNLVSPNCFSQIPAFYTPQLPEYEWMDFSIGTSCLLEENTSYWMVFSSPTSNLSGTYVIWVTPEIYYPGHFNYFNGIIWIDYSVVKLMFKEYTEEHVACYANTDCGTDSWIEAPVCNEGNVFQLYRVFTCNEPGTPASYCSETDSFSLKQECVDPTPYCENGECVSDMPLDQRVFALEQQVQNLTSQNNALTARVDSLETKDQEQDTRMTGIETTVNNLFFQLQTALDSFIEKITSYLTNLNLETKTDILCGYMENNGLDRYSDIGTTCRIVNDECKCIQQLEAISVLDPA